MNVINNIYRILITGENMKLVLSILFSLLLLIECDNIISEYAYYPDTEFLIDKKNFFDYMTLVKIGTSDGLTIKGLFFCHQNKNKNNILLIYFHGNAGNIYNRITEASKVYNMGTDVLVVSYRGYAGSGGAPAEKGTYIDGESAYNYAVNDLRYKESKIILYGRSIGTTVAVHIA